MAHVSCRAALGAAPQHTIFLTMPSITSDNRFFGLDLKALQHDLGKAWRNLRHAPALAWLTPALSIRLLQADGAESLWRASEAAPQRDPRGHARNVRFVAVELPEELLLRRSLAMPVMSAVAVAEAVALDVRSSSPFAAGDLAWGFSSSATGQRGLQVDIVLASRKQIAQHLQNLQGKLPSAAQAEVWALAPGRQPMVLAGFGEIQRNRAVARGRRASYALLGLAALFLIAIAITPTLQLRQRAIEAVNSFDALSQRTAPLIRQREALVQADGQLAVLHDILNERVDPLRAMELLTQALPDDTSIYTLRMQGNKVSMTGQTGNAAALMQLLSAHPALRDVRAPSAAMRPPGTTKDTFNIELMIDAQAFAPKASALPAASNSASAPSPAASAPAPVPDLKATP